jgi:hypothetical protein
MADPCNVKQVIHQAGETSGLTGNQRACPIDIRIAS